MVNFNIEEGAMLPEYKTALASGMDIAAFRIVQVYRGDREIDPENLIKVQNSFIERGYIKLRSLERIIFGTGLKVNMPMELEAQVRPRSGIVAKRGLTVLNSPGTIDADFEGEIGVILYNSTPFLNKVDRGERIAQLVFAKVERPEIKFVHFLSSDSERGDAGFGSTGTK